MTTNKGAPMCDNNYDIERTSSSEEEAQKLIKIAEQFLESNETATAPKTDTVRQIQLDPLIIKVLSNKNFI